jgi:hypothetical protein
MLAGREVGRRWGEVRESMSDILLWQYPRPKCFLSLKHTVESFPLYFLELLMAPKKIVFRIEWAMTSVVKRAGAHFETRVNIEPRSWKPRQFSPYSNIKLKL